jgi:hypothetical protein
VWNRAANRPLVGEETQQKTGAGTEMLHNSRRRSNNTCTSVRQGWIALTGPGRSHMGSTSGGGGERLSGTTVSAARSFDKSRPDRRPDRRLSSPRHSSHSSRTPCSHRPYCVSLLERYPNTIACNGQILQFSATSSCCWVWESATT